VESVHRSRAFADALVLAKNKVIDGRRTLREVLQATEAELDSFGLAVLSPYEPDGEYSRPRRLELAAAINRLRTIQVRKAGR
jgi:hypothetical protein